MADCGVGAGPTQCSLGVVQTLQEGELLSTCRREGLPKLFTALRESGDGLPEGGLCDGRGGRRWRKGLTTRRMNGPCALRVPR